MSFAIEKYVLHEHDAKTAKLHWDFRVQIPNRDSLASFAIPKARIPQKPGEKVLAVRGNDHSRIWLSIETITIPENEYGSGKIRTLQRGMCNIEGWGNNHITFNIKGDPDFKDGFSGRYALIRFKGTKSGDRNNIWVLLKTKQQ